MIDAEIKEKIISTVTGKVAKNSPDDIFNALKQIELIELGRANCSLTVSDPLTNQLSIDLLMSKPSKSKCKEIGERLKKARSLNKAYTQQWLSERTGVDRSLISRIEKGSAAQFHDLLMICRWLPVYFSHIAFDISIHKYGIPSFLLLDGLNALREKNPNVALFSDEEIDSINILIYELLERLDAHNKELEDYL